MLVSLTLYSFLLYFLQSQQFLHCISVQFINSLSENDKNVLPYKLIYHSDFISCFFDGVLFMWLILQFPGTNIFECIILVLYILKDEQFGAFFWSYLIIFLCHLF